jgi:toxin ParE1/3/4
MGIYKLSKAAATDIEDIFEYGFFRFGSEQAKNYIEAMEQHFLLLSDNVGLGREAEELTDGLRRFSYGSHVIFYITIPHGILVVRVLHQSMDFEQHL